ncbi:hypothetical protein HY311_02685 [Candidatus Nomurabacteria bacterium]|nr:hypothetical protein [Candidatus Nomurabacteria bacterium]
MKKTLYIIILVAVIMLAVVLGFIYFNSKKINTPNVNVSDYVPSKPVVENQKQDGSLHVQVVQIGNVPAHYEYRVVNNSNYAIKRIIIGREDYYKGSPELATPPLNFSFDTFADPGSITQPVGWKGEVQTMEESNFIELHWSTDKANSFLLSGQTLSGLGVTLPKLDDSYVNSHWTVIFFNGSTVSGPLEKL